MFDVIVIFVIFGFDLVLVFSLVSSVVWDSVVLLVFFRLWWVVKIMIGEWYKKCFKKKYMKYYIYIIWF